MRPPRVVIAAAFFATVLFFTFISLRSSHPPQTIRTSETGALAFFSFRAPFSLFPPNAIITLTHENSTAFLARPAAFGPPLPTEGLKGQVWIGSGFGDDGRAEGELGCSDVPSWAETSPNPGAMISNGAKSVDVNAATASAKFWSKRGGDENGPFGDRTAAPSDLVSPKDAIEPYIDDGTDDYLHQPLTESTVSKPPEQWPAESETNHADIQSIQEGAEIAGKVVLLSRGGCGFLEKVKWAQRRGALALIVGDDTKGGPLIQMYARGDTSNVTIPSIFTSRTTAHLLSSLIGSGTYSEVSTDENGSPGLKVQSMAKAKKAKKKQISTPTFTPAVPARPTATVRASRIANKKTSTPTEDTSASMTTERPGWFRSLFFGTSNGNSKADSSRPPSSGQLDWVLVDDWKDAGPRKFSGKSDKKSKGTKASQKNKGDDFVIGVQDWRDPDLVGPSGAKDTESKAGAKGGKSDATRTNNSPRPTKAGKKHTGGALQDIPEWIPPLRGGSITPGSGEYVSKVSQEQEKTEAKEEQNYPTATGRKSKSLLAAIFGDDEEDVDVITPDPSQETLSEAEDGDEEYEGLWVTLTPTSGASPFLDTLLVLVVSPLVTLTVVYALLLIRSRIRRRRWRAPKSVVERLPVRTYHTMAASGSQSPRLPSPTTSSVTTPLLQHSPTSRPRPRSRTTTGIPEPGDLARVNSQPLEVPSLLPKAPEHEKNASVSSEWKKYMGRQVECVVCLEEYVDGVSRVMSLPCGHEFHEDCITPWLITRRRTCPICKGDVVRSMARGSPSSPRYEPYHDDSDEDVQIQAAESVNESASSALPVTRSLYDNENDLEQGQSSASPSRSLATNRGRSWRSIIASSILTPQSPQPPQEDTDRNR